MNSKNLTLLIFLVILLTSCLPDSFTKFKEDPPSKDAITGGASGGQGGGTSSNSSDIRYTVSEVEFYQSKSDIYVFSVADGSGFNVGDTVNFSVSLFPSSTETFNSVGTIRSKNSATDDLGGLGEVIWLAVSIDGGASGNISLNGQNIDFDYDGNFLGFNTGYASDTAVSYKFIGQNYYIDNCSGGYYACALGSYTTSFVTSVPALKVPPGIPSVDAFPNAPGKSLSKRVHLKGSGVEDAANLTWDYSFSTNLLGVGVVDTTSGVSSDDRLQSPYGAFSIDTSAFGSNGGTFSLGVNVSLNSADYGSGLNSEEQGSTNLILVTEVPGEPIETIEEFELTYYIENGQRFAVQVANATGFNDGEVVRACSTPVYSGCDTDNEATTIFGKATIDDIDYQRSVLYLTAADFDHDGEFNSDYPSLFKNGNFIHSSSGYTSAQTSKTARLYRDTDSGITITPEFNQPLDLTDNPTNTIVYSVDSIPDSGFSIDAGTGVISISNPNFVYNADVTVTATDQTTGLAIDTFILNLNFVGNPTALIYPGVTGSSYNYEAVIGQSDSQNIEAVLDGNSDVTSLSSTNGVDIGYIKFSPVTPLPTDVTQTVAANVFALTYSPSAFDNGSTSYQIEGYFPAFDASSAFGSVTATFNSATNFDQIRFPQEIGDILILKVGDVAPFSTASGANSVSSLAGGSGTVTFIDTGNSAIYVEVNSGLSGDLVFKPEDPLDNTPSFVIERTKITNFNDSVVHVFDTGDSNSRFSPGLVPSLYDNSGALVTLASGETLTWAITPSVPSDLNFNTANGSFSAVVGGSITNLAPTVYTLSATNSIGDIVTSEYAFTVAEIPENASVGRYQFIRISGNTNNFYRGTRVQASDDTSGRVLMTIDSDGDGTNDGLLLENNGDFADGVGLDNTSVYRAAEATVVPYHFLYVKDLSSSSFPNGVLTVGDIIYADDGNTTGEIAEIYSTDNKLYVKVLTGSFDASDKISTQPTGGDSTIIKSVVTRHYITGVIQVNSQSASDDFEIGGLISTNSAGKGIVIQKHQDNSHYGLTRYYLLIQHISGNFSQGDNIDDEATYSASVGTISRVVGPNLDLNATGGSVTSSNRKDSAGNPFFEGNLVAAFSDDANRSFKSVGFSVFGTDVANDNIRVQVEDFYNHFDETSTYLDDFVSSLPAVQTGDHRNLAGVTLSNLMIGYVGEGFQLEPTVKGEYNSVTIAPDTLPTGLTFNTVTGQITGTPTEPLAGESYTLTFNSALGTPASYSFDLVVYNQFEISQDTDNSSSYVVHREGQGLGTSRCKVFGPQVIDDLSNPNYNQSIYATNDIVCLFEGGESDLYNLGIDFEVKSGAGMCEFIRYTPYSYLSFPRGATNREVTVYQPFAEAGTCTAVNGGGSYITSGAPLTNPTATRNQGFGRTYCESGECVVDQVASQVCSFDYSQTDSDWPNMDTGEITVNTVSCTAEDDGAGTINCTCSVDSEDVKVDCGGERINGISGAKRSVLTNLEKSAVVTPTVSGGSFPFDVESPISKGLASNRYLANFFASRAYVPSGSPGADSCYETKTTMDAYSSPGVLSTNRKELEDYNDAFDPLGTSVNDSFHNFYTFECLDAANNPKAKIRLIVRDWDREFSPEDEELESLVGVGQSSTSSVGINYTAGSLAATLSSTIDADTFLGRGSVLYLEGNPLAPDNFYQPSVDNIRLDIASYDGGTDLRLKNAPSSNGTNVQFNIRSKISDPSDTCFGDTCDRRQGHDSRNQILDFTNHQSGTPAADNLTKPQYNSCGGSGQTINAIGPLSGTFVANSRTVTFAAGTFNDSNKPARGQILIVDTDNSGGYTTDEPYFVITNSSANSITLATQPGFSGTRNAYIVKKIPFSLEEPK